MKKNCWLFLGLMVATSAVAQSNTNTAAPSAPAPVIVPAPNDPVPTNPAPKPKKAAPKHKKSVVALPPKVAITEPAITLIPGPAEVAADNVNVRGQAGLKGEFITHLSKGEAVTILSQINLDKHQIDEPSQWAKIAFPTNAHVWVNTQFIDATNKTVLVKKLNLRAGPGENYSVLGVIERGTPLNTLVTRGDWTQIEPPTGAYAFIAAMYVKQEASGNLATNPGPSTETQPVPTPAPEVVATPAPTPTPVPEAQPIVTEATNPPVPLPAPVTAPVVETPAPVPTPPPVVTAPAPVPAPTPVPVPAIEATNSTAEVVTNPPPPRIVTHEGVVRHVTSVIEPTDYELFDPKTGTDINYLYTTTTNLDLARYKGLRIVVTGEERLSQRWENTPVLTIQEIKVIK